MCKSKEKGKKATTTKIPPSSYHCDFSSEGEQGPVQFEVSRKGREKKQHISYFLKPTQELEIWKIVYNYLCWVKLNCLYLQ